MKDSGLEPLRPNDFLTNDEFQALSDYDKERYLERFIKALRPLLVSGDLTPWMLTYLEHLLDGLLESGMPPEMEESLRSRLWEFFVEEPEAISKLLQRVLNDDPRTSPDEREEFREMISELEALIDQKQAFEEQPD